MESAASAASGTQRQVNPPRRRVPYAGGVALLAGLAIFASVGTSVTSTLEKVGAVDRRETVVAAVVAALGAVSASLGSAAVVKQVTSAGRTVVVATAVLVAGALAALAVFLYTARPNAEYVQGHLSADEPFAHRVLISGGNGYRYYITFAPSATLVADVQLRGGGQPIAGTLRDNGVQEIEGVLVGNTTWTAIMRQREGEGKYLVYVDSAAPEEVEVDGPPRNRALDVGRTRTGFVFRVSGPPAEHPVFLSAKASGAGQPNPGIVLRTDRGTPMGNVPPRRDGVIFTTVPTGSYVVEVQGQPGQGFVLTLASRNPGNPVETPPMPAPDETARVPDVAGRPGAEAVSRLTSAGFVVQSYPVCSNRLFDAKAAVGTTRQVVRNDAATGESEIVSDTRVVVPVLAKGTRLDVKVFSGLPCT